MTTESGYCFSFQWNITLDWAAAGRHCHNVGGHLATVNGVDDQQYLVELLLQAGVAEVWLGAQQVVTDWTWVSGEYFCVYDNFTFCFIK